eukprot:CAMPEP_0206811238 /NCGR_PEP_ID=MMETSP0975-20121206/7158_1 /ASSEMBLY_ACC=CAM_ASM_000399 /TAXON_ID=483370 /ORGANISM="non described non described, Strain CCMP2097" /LENGTH=210 /DNA_ID=CAMNT_0054353361 /DNA_START=18 /DNA_END=646 /DNA_ORIENTATION=+
MSALRNAVKRRTHKERAQPAARRGLGLLEKKQDYKERSVNFHKKQDALKTLRKKAAERNPDEFYHKMTKSVADQPEARLEATMKHADIVKLKSQDYKLVSMRKAVADQKVEKLRASLHATEASTRSNEKTYFVGAGESAPAAPAAAEGPATKAARRAQKQVRKAYGSLAAALERKRTTARTLEYLASEKAAMTAKGRKRKVQDAENGKPA